MKTRQRLALPGCVVIDNDNGYILFYISHIVTAGDVKHGYGFCARTKTNDNINEGLHSFFAEIPDADDIVVVGPVSE